MAIRFPCPFCKTANTCNDDKRGQKIACRGCKKPLSVPAAKKTRLAEAAIPESTKVKAKKTVLANGNGHDDEDKSEDNDQRSAVKKKDKKDKKATKKVFPVKLVASIGVAVLVFLMVGGGVGGYFWWRSRSESDRQRKLDEEHAHKETTQPRNPQKETTQTGEPKKDTTLVDKKDPPANEKNRFLLPVVDGLQKNSANLTANLEVPRERTVKVKAALKTVGAIKDKQLPVTAKTEATFLEVIEADVQGAQLKTAIAQPHFSVEAGGEVYPVPKEVTDSIIAFAPVYTLDKNNSITQRTHRNPKGTKKEVEQTLEALSSLCKLLELGMLALPNRTVNANENWSFVMSLPVDEKKVSPVTLGLHCTYEGTRQMGRPEAIIRATGRLTTSDPSLKKFEGQYEGLFVFDLAEQTIASAQIKLTNEPFGKAMNSEKVFTLDIELERTSGNPQNLQLPVDPETKPTPEPKKPPANATPFFDQSGFLLTSSPPDPRAEKGVKSHATAVIVPNMAAGKTYTITVEATGFNPRVRVEGFGTSGVSGGGTSSATTITFRPTATNPYRIIISAHDGKTGTYQLTVLESP
jgi:hypothetical protein